MPNGTIQAAASIAIDLGQTTTVDAMGNLSTPAEEGTPSAVSINNAASTPWTCGIAQLAGSQANPMVALPLYGNTLEVIAPIEKVLLMFATLTINTGTVIYRSYSAGVFIDLTSEQNRVVTFDINTSWDWGGENWATAIPAQADLVPVLISNPASVRAPSARTVSIAPGATRVFPAGTVEDSVELENRHNVTGNVMYQIDDRSPVTVPMRPNEEVTIGDVHGQQLTVTNALPNTLYCVY